MTFLTHPCVQGFLLASFAKGSGFQNTILLQCKQERFGVGGLVIGWSRETHLGMETYYGSMK